MFSLSSSFVKTPREFAALAPRGGVEAGAKAFARDNMVAIVMLANDDAVAYFFDVANNRFAKKIYRNPQWVA